MKQKIRTKVMETESAQIMRSIIPSHWEIREYHPDYGIDFAIEVFEERDGVIFETAGEHLFIQLKSTQKIKLQEIYLFDRPNVEKFPDFALSKGKNKCQCIAYSMDYSEMELSFQMSAAVPLMLFLVDLTSGKMYMICLTDYYEKIGFKRQLDKPNQKSLTIYIPIHNEVNTLNACSLRYFSARPKLYYFFNKSYYFKYELIMMDPMEKIRLSIIFLEKIKNIIPFILINKKEMTYFFDKIEMLHEEYYKALNSKSKTKLWAKELNIALENVRIANKSQPGCVLAQALRDKRMEIFDHMAMCDNDTFEKIERVSDRLDWAWSDLCTISRVFEDLEREWLLPTSLF